MSVLLTMSFFDFLWRRRAQPEPKQPTVPAELPVMLILRGIAGHFAGKDWPHGALDEAPALEYARRRGYAGKVLDVSGETGAASRQVQMCLEAIRKDADAAALYGFSGGGYNIHHALNALNDTERARIKLVIVLGAPGNPASIYRGPWELVYRTDPPAGHMAGPSALLAELSPTTLHVAKVPINAYGSLQNPAFSPDGTKLCFTRFRGDGEEHFYNSGRSDIGIYDIASGATLFLELAGEANVSQPGSCWSDRGIIFSSDMHGPDCAHVWNDGRVQKLWFSEGMTWEPSWGPDFYCAERVLNGVHQIVKCDFAGHAEVLTADSRDCRQPCVSPDGRTVVFQEQAARGWRLVLLDLATRHERDLGGGTDATFSRDGTRIVYSDTAGRLAVLDLASGKSALVTVATPYSGAPSFSQDGKFIAYEGGPKGDDDGPATAIYIAEAP